MLPIQRALADMLPVLLKFRTPSFTVMFPRNQLFVPARVCVPLPILVMAPTVLPE